MFILNDIVIFILVISILYLLNSFRPDSFVVNDFLLPRVLLALCLLLLARFAFRIYSIEWNKALSDAYVRLFIADGIACLLYVLVGYVDWSRYLGFSFSVLLYVSVLVGTIASRLLYQKIDTNKQRNVAKKVQFSPPDITDAEIAEVVDALKSGWITTGPRTKQFERNIQEFLKVNRACCLNSQTACAEMALRLLGIGPGDEVITSAYTYTASASVIDHVGATIVLVDCEKDSYEINYEQVEKAITAKTKAIIPIDIGGIPCNYDR
ncbi:MAG: DegT/DnrJ/EryC1/StrS aminotransferase family protein, partial [Erysipelotrichaceae bacterium]|nr:DegT/DnrJ/EryC1/StrS aminotransferase family protein [Erysipelotrichaceae bacterium]